MTMKPPALAAAGVDAVAAVYVAGAHVVLEYVPRVGDGEMHVESNDALTKLATKSDDAVPAVHAADVVYTVLATVLGGAATDVEERNLPNTPPPPRPDAATLLHVPPTVPFKLKTPTPLQLAVGYSDSVAKVFPLTVVVTSFWYHAVPLVVPHRLIWYTYTPNKPLNNSVLHAGSLYSVIDMNVCDCNRTGSAAAARNQRRIMALNRIKNRAN